MTYAAGRRIIDADSHVIELDDFLHNVVAAEHATLLPAMADQQACVSCHEEDTCLACHAGTQVASPGLGVSPHGPNFGSSLRCQTLANRNRRACLQCHAPGEPQLNCR